MSTSLPTRSRERYAVPVFRFDDPDAPDNPRMTDDDAGDSVLVRLEDSQVGNPVIRVTDTSAGTTDRYRFRVTDPEKQWCAYFGDDPTDLPVPVQYAVHAFGFGIDDLRSLDDRLFDLLEVHRLATELLNLESEFDGLPLYEVAVKGTARAFGKLAMVLLARYGMPAADYWTLWDDFLASPQSQGETCTSAGPGQYFYDAACGYDPVKRFETDADAGEHRCHQITTLTELSAMDGEYIMVDLMTEFGVQRFPFRRTSPGTCDYQRRHGFRVPPSVILELQANGETVRNVDTVADAETPCEIIGQAAGVCAELAERTLIPSAARDTPNDAVGNASDSARIAGVLFAAVEVDRQTTRTVHREICDRYGITAAEHLQGDVGWQALRLFAHSLLETHDDRLRDALPDSIVTEGVPVGR